MKTDVWIDVSSCATKVEANLIMPDGGGTPFGMLLLGRIEDCTVHMFLHDEEIARRISCECARMAVLIEQARMKAGEPR